MTAASKGAPRDWQIICVGHVDWRSEISEAEPSQMSWSNGKKNDVQILNECISEKNWQWIHKGLLFKFQRTNLKASPNVK